MAKYHIFTHHCPKNVHLIGGGCNTVFPPCLQGSPVFTACTVQCFQMFRWCMLMLNLKWKCDCGMAVLLSHTTICSANDWLNVSVSVCVWERFCPAAMNYRCGQRKHLSKCVYYLWVCVWVCETTDQTLVTAISAHPPLTNTNYIWYLIQLFLDKCHDNIIVLSEVP